MHLPSLELPVELPFSLFTHAFLYLSLMEIFLKIIGKDAALEEEFDFRFSVKTHERTEFWSNMARQGEGEGEGGGEGGGEETQPWSDRYVSLGMSLSFTTLFWSEKTQQVYPVLESKTLIIYPVLDLLIFLYCIVLYCVVLYWRQRSYSSSYLFYRMILPWNFSSTMFVQRVLIFYHCYYCF